MYLEKAVKSLHPGGFHNIIYSEYQADPVKNRGKTVVCVHGLSRNGKDFHWLAEHLAADGYRVICPDLPGRGRSANFENPAWYNYPQYMADMVSLLAALNVDQVDWIGTSMGGLIGMMLAAQQNHPIKNMVINDVGPFIPAAALQHIKSYVSLNPSYATWESFLCAFKKRMVSFGLQTDQEWEEFAKISYAQDANGAYKMNYDPKIVFGLETAGPITDVDLWPLWSVVNVPLLILRGGQSDVLSRETVDKMMIGKRATAVTFANVGHAPTLMNAEQMNAVNEWLANN